MIWKIPKAENPVITESIEIPGGNQTAAWRGVINSPFTQRAVESTAVVSLLYGKDICNDYIEAQRFKEILKGGEKIVFFRGKRFGYQATSWKMKIVSLPQLQHAIDVAAGEKR